MEWGRFEDGEKGSLVSIPRSPVLDSAHLELKVAKLSRDVPDQFLTKRRTFLAMCASTLVAVHLDLPTDSELLALGQKARRLRALSIHGHQIAVKDLMKTTENFFIMAGSNLEFLDLDSRSAEEMLKSVAQHCRSLKYAQIHPPIHADRSDNTNNLDEETIDLPTFFASAGRSLQSLHIYLRRNAHLNNIVTAIAAYCPNIERIVLHVCYDDLSKQHKPKTPSTD
ncbi:hypothetical protein HK102_003766, partial [Quaeritorhiza haematococci]